MHATFTDALGETQTIHWNQETLLNVLDQTGINLTEIYEPELGKSLADRPEQAVVIVAVMAWPDADEPFRSARMNNMQTVEQALDAFFSLATQACENLLKALPEEPTTLAEAIALVVN